MSTSIAPQGDELLGQLVLGRYRIVRPLGRGGMGVVYLARLEGAAGFARPVVIKRIVPDLTGDTTMSQLFVREARILSHLVSPGIVSVVDFGEENHAYVMVLEYVHGYNLGQWHKYVRGTRGQLPVTHANHVIIKTLEALHFAHTFRRPDGSQLRIIHRDVSPSNILLDVRGSVKLHDFGIARTEDANEFKTTDGSFKGKLAFTPPEVFAGEPASPQSDLYAAGVVLYQLLTSQNPFRAKEMGETVSKVLTYVPPPISAYREEVPDGLDEIVARALAKKKEDRFESALEFADALRSLRSQSDDQVVEELARVFAADFAKMPEHMRIDSLEARDTAWRDAQNVPASNKLPLSSWPPDGGESTQQEGRSDASTKRALSVTTERTVAAAQHPTLSTKRSFPVVGMLGVLAAVLVAIGALVVALMRAPTNDKPKYLVLERTRPDVTAPRSLGDTKAPAAAVEPAFAPTQQAAAPNALAQAATGTSPPLKPPVSAPKDPLGNKPDPRALTRTFSRHQGSIERCFHQHASNLTGQPQISVRFKVDQLGMVRTAELIPQGLTSTPLGSCVLGVSRAIKFGPQSEPVAFTIPITARKVQ